MHSNQFDPAAPLPTAGTATVDASKTATTIEALLDGISTCASRAANTDAYSAQQCGQAAEHLARALDIVADFGQR